MNHPSENQPILLRYPTVWAMILGGCSSLLISLFALRAMPLASDALAYHEEAVKLLSGPSDVFYYPPGMIFYLAGWYRLLGASAFAARLAVVGTVGLTVFFSCRLARELFRDRRVVFSTGIFAALYPPILLLSSQPYSQHLALPGLLAVAFFWLKALSTRKLGYFIGCGLALGVSVLTRPSVLAIGLVLAFSGLASLYMIIRRKEEQGRGAAIRLVAGAALTLLIGACLVFPVVRYHHQRGAGWVLSTNNERNFLLGNCPFTPLYRTDDLAQHPLKSFPPRVQDYLKAFYDLGFSTPAARRAMRSEALNQIHTHPGWFILRTLNRARAFWGFDYLASRRIQSWRKCSFLTIAPLFLLEAGGYCLLMLLILKAACNSMIWQSHRREMVILLGLVFCYQLPYCLAFSSGTYHFPVMGLLFPLAGLGFINLKDQWSVEGIRTLLRQPKVVYFAWAVFALLQVEYAFFSW